MGVGRQRARPIPTPCCLGPGDRGDELASSIAFPLRSEPASMPLHSRRRTLALIAFTVSYSPVPPRRATKRAYGTCLPPSSQHAGQRRGCALVGRLARTPEQDHWRRTSPTNPLTKVCVIGREGCDGGSPALRTEDTHGRVRTRNGVDHRGRPTGVDRCGSGGRASRGRLGSGAQLLVAVRRPRMGRSWPRRPGGDCRGLPCAR